MKTKMLKKFKNTLSITFIICMIVSIGIINTSAATTSHSVSVKLKNGYTVKPSYSYNSSMAKSAISVTNGSPIGLSCTVIYDEYTKSGKAIYTSKTVSNTYKTCSSSSKKVDVSADSHVLYNMYCISYTNTSSSSVNINNNYFTGIILGSGRFSSVVLNKK
ncbi:MAG: hypothetical protein PUC69_05255 [Ruminococcus sp.]|nr:hypothetical protein [Ruminococcus sp.]MDD5890005.1 hypothetical protein [Ruminococcus sp.]